VEEQRSYALSRTILKIDSRDIIEMAILKDTDLFQLDEPLLLFDADVIKFMDYGQKTS
jgi:hypothetical protein